MRLLDVLKDKKILTPPPVWMMRQAGRYLPEYREIRENFHDFIEFCLAPEAVAEVTLQPLRRFPLDAAIIFSDILVIPHALGQDVWFEKNYGPHLRDVNLKDIVEKSHQVDLRKILKKVGEGISLTRKKLPADKALIGFSGAPWTLLTYMISQGKTKNFEDVLRYAEKNKSLFQELLNLLIDQIVNLLSFHIESGVNVVQIFESWAGAVPASHRERYLFDPLYAIVDRVQKRHPQIPIIYYGRGISDDYEHLQSLNIAFGIDETACLKKIRQSLPNHVLQGNLSPKTLLSGDHLEKEISSILEITQNTPFIFNLGHGIHKDTPIAHVEKLFKCLL